MNVLFYKAVSGLIEIRISTAANIDKLRHRFYSRVGDWKRAHEYCDYSSTIPGILSLYGSEESEVAASLWTARPPVFFDTAVYNVNIRFKNIDGKPEIQHTLMSVCNRFDAINIGDDDWMLSGSIDLMNEPGLFDLAFRYKPKGASERRDTLSFRVVSPKLDCKRDYRRMLDEIHEEFGETVLKFFSKTFMCLNLGGASRNELIWISIFRAIADNYIGAVEYVVNRPHIRKISEIRFSRADKIRYWSAGMARRYIEKEAEGLAERDLFRHEIVESTHDTRENRFVKYSLEHIGKKLGDIINRLASFAMSDEKQISDIEAAMLDGYRSRLLRLSRTKSLRGLRGEALRYESMVLQKKTGYAQIYRDWLLLRKSVNLLDGAVKIGARPIWELYELWCFLYMRKTIANILGLDMSNDEEVVEDPMSMIDSFTEDRATHTVLYKAKNGDKVILGYQYTFKRGSRKIHTATTENRPDITLSIRKNDGRVLTYLYDAKYRVTDDEKFSSEDINEMRNLGVGGADYPPSETLNQMHRYRDAIYYGENGDECVAKEIVGGYILFPGRGSDENVRKRYYYKSISKVNIGAFPLLPACVDSANEGNLLREHLEKILVKQTVAEQIGNSIPQRGLVYSSDTFSNRSSHE